MHAHVCVCACVREAQRRVEPVTLYHPGKRAQHSTELFRPLNIMSQIHNVSGSCLFADILLIILCLN